MNRRQFATATLRELGIHPNTHNVTAMVGWMKAEGGHWHNTAKFNPLNTTQNMPGSGDTGSQGNISVYRDWDQGIKATVQTLKNGRYDGILHALKHGRPSDVAAAIDKSPWGTHGPLLYSVMGGAPVAPAAGSVQPLARTAVQRDRQKDPAAADPLAAFQVDQKKMAQRQFVGSLIAERRGPQSTLAQMLGAGATEGPTNTSLQLALTMAQKDPKQKTRQGPKSSSEIAVKGSMPATLARMIETANRIDSKHMNYAWGGGHNPGHTPTKGYGHGSGPNPGFDCSGAVAKVLGVDARVSGEFARWGKPGKGKNVTVYANGHHVLMEINGHFWGTSSSNPGGGAGWIDKGQMSASYLSQFTARHPPGM